jgi:hypothetical protein
VRTGFIRDFAGQSTRNAFHARLNTLSGCVAQRAEIGYATCDTHVCASSVDIRACGFGRSTWTSARRHFTSAGINRRLVFLAAPARGWLGQAREAIREYLDRIGPFCRIRVTPVSPISLRHAFTRWVRASLAVIAERRAIEAAALSCRIAADAGRCAATSARACSTAGCCCAPGCSRATDAGCRGTTGSGSARCCDGACRIR